jgi:hypothetical protein
MLHISVFGKVVLNVDLCAPDGVPILVFKNPGLMLRMSHFRTNVLVTETSELLYITLCLQSDKR